MESIVKRSILFLSGKVVAEFAKKHGIEKQESLELFLSSKTFKNLSNPKTELWKEGFVSVYHSFEDETIKL